MKIEQIRHTCIKASEVYYKYLDDNNKGVYNISIRKIEKIGKDRFKLNINGRIFDEETLVFKNLATNKDYTVEDIKIQVYDRDTNTVVIKPKSDIYSKLLNANANDWILVSDLKFLVERVRQWYVHNGKDIELPKKSSSLKPPESSIYFKNEAPSDEQKKALNVIFNKPLSYIWGAPGTGKTQFVLSYAILHYLANKKKVAIVAPTNHALEQIYRGVIKMTDKAGINREKILRLGGPSKKFADEFPEVCELIGLENQLRQINKQIDILENILGIDEYSEREKNIGLLISKLETFKNQLICFEELNKKKLIPLEKISQINKENRSLDLKLKYNSDEQKKLISKKDSWVYKLTSLFSSKVDFDKEIDGLLEKQSEIESNIELNKSKIKKETSNLILLENKISQTDDEIIAIQIEYNNCLKFLPNFPKVDELTLDTNYDEETEKLNLELKGINNKRPVYESLSKEYIGLDKLAVESKYEKLKIERDRLADYSLEKRLKNVSIVGATLDSYLYRYKEEKLNADHIFLDEAGYSNIIKAMTLFNQGIPVTFLGDHMQLPPVCEISKRDIQHNDEYRPVMVWDQSAIFLEDLFEHNDLNKIVHRYINNTQATFKNLVKSNLTGTFRFGNSLANVLQTHVYPEGFRSELNTETEIIVYHVQNPTYNQNGTRLNILEVEAITSLIRNNYNEESNVAVLAPYSAQVSALSNKLPDFQRQNKVLTVHKSQGQEWDTVIYSVCDIGNGKTPWFTDSQNSLSNGLNNINTAISRAKKTLIVVCNPNEWKFFQDQLVTGIINVSTKTIIYES